MGLTDKKRALVEADFNKICQLLYSADTVSVKLGLQMALAYKIAGFSKAYSFKLLINYFILYGFYQVKDKIEDEHTCFCNSWFFYPRKAKDLGIEHKNFEIGIDIEWFKTHKDGKYGDGYTEYSHEYKKDIFQPIADLVFESITTYDHSSLDTDITYYGKKISTVFKTLLKKL